ncbi:MAG: D-alanine--D-alanine ligase A [Candidatus Aminicenantes bacterium RBG_16_63_14]|nr:MAG: D-alanine--D-alanine ligase A [Candidatus Aminicenantes bacterium RBG_16_63_14]OGD28035.1 MAG: D-alanine--D-alanine ligase A [Candidatus Aminicenantes bacterium RBG_19FT_COMBO_65_30]
MSKKISIALIFGGRSAEHEISLISAAAVHKNLDKDKFEVRSIYITRDGRWKSVEAPSMDVETVEQGRAFSFLPWEAGSPGPGLGADIYFPILHGPYGEDGTIQGLLEMAGVPYVGAGVAGSALGMDKALAKSVLRDHGLPVVPCLVIRETEWEDNAAKLLRRVRRSLPLPLFVKPSNLGSSVGITKVGDYGDVPAALAAAFRYDATALVEKGIAGRELELSVLGNETPEASLPGEVIPFREFYDYNDKYIDGKTTFVIPAKLGPRTLAKIRTLAVAAFKALACSGMARVDFFLEKGTNRLYVSEINTIPGFTDISMYPKLWAASGLPFPRLLERLVELGFERHRNRKACVERDR